MANIPDVKIRLLVENGQMKVGFGDASKAVQQFASTTSQQAGQAGTALDALTSKVNRLEGGLETLKDFGGAFLGLAGLKALVGTFVQNQIALDQVKNTLNAATGSARKGAEEFAYLEAVAQRTGVRIAQVGDIYGGYMAAAKQANLTTAETRDLFEATAEAGAVYGLSAGRMQSVMIALQQMMGMGVIKSQELRYQLGSALPGAFTAFKKLVESKGIDFNEQLQKGFDVKKFAPMLSEAIRTLYSEKDVEAAANDLQSQISKMVNAISLFKESLSNGPFSDALGFLLGTVTQLLNALSGGESSFGQWALTIGVATIAFAALSKALNFAYDRVAAVVREMSAQVSASSAVNAATQSQVAASRNLALAKQAEILALQASLRAKQAELVVDLRVTEMQLVMARQSLQAAQAKGVSAVASGELAAAESRVQAAEARVQATRLQLIATTRAKVAVNRQAAASSLQVAGAETASGNAAAGAAAKMGAATIASRGLAVAGRTLLGVVGGWPGVIFAAVAALAVFITKQSEAEAQTQSLINKLQEGRQAMASFAGNWKDLAAARKVYADALEKGNKDDIQAAEEALRIAQQAMLEGRSSAKIAAAKADSEAEAARKRLDAADKELKLAQKAAFERIKTSREGYNPEFDARVLSAKNKVEEAQKQVTAATNQAKLAQDQLNATEAQGRKESADHAQATAAQTIARDAEAAATARQTAAEEARLKLLPVAQRIKEAQDSAVKNSDDLKAITDPQMRAEAEKLLRQSIEDRIMSEEKAAKTTDGSAKATRDAARAAKEYQRDSEQVAEAVQKIYETAEDYEDQLRLVDQVTQNTARRTRELDRASADAEKTIKSSTLSDKQKEQALKDLKTATDRAAAAIQNLDAKERTRQEREAKESLGDFYGDTSRTSAENNYDVAALMQMDKAKAERESRDAKEQFEISMGRMMTPEEELQHRQKLQEHWYNIETDYGLHIDRMKEWNEDFKVNANRALGSSIRMALQGDFQGIADMWKDMLLDMVAQFIQSKIMDYVNKIGQASSASSSSSSGSGWVGIANAVVGAFFGGKAEGGPVSGPGTSTSDSIPTYLSDGEFVVKASAVDQYGLSFLHAINAGRLGPKQARGFASGGLVSRGGSSDSGGLGVEVNVHNYSGEKTEVRRGRGPSGEEQIDVIIGKVAASVRENGEVGQAIQGTFGVGRRGVAR